MAYTLANKCIHWMSCFSYHIISYLLIFYIYIYIYIYIEREREEEEKSAVCKYKMFKQNVQTMQLSIYK